MQKRIKREANGRQKRFRVCRHVLSNSEDKSTVGANKQGCTMLFRVAARVVAIGEKARIG